jgi:hypothetical protein
LLPGWLKLLKNWKAEKEPEFKESRYVWRVYVEQLRQRRLVGILEFKEESPAELQKLPPQLIDGLINIFSPGNAITFNRWEALCKKWAGRLSLDADFIMKSVYDCGLVGRFTRLKADEKSIHSVIYGPMAPLTSLCEKKSKDLIEHNKKWLDKIKRPIYGIAHDFTYENEDIKKQALSSIHGFVLNKISQIEALPPDGSSLKIHDNLSWYFIWDKPRGKFHLALEFLLAVMKVAGRSSGGFEWKELGAAVDDSIGGSKRFDNDTDKLLVLLEDITVLPLDDMGLTSRGSLYPVYILGSIELHTNASTKALDRSIHAITNLEIEKLQKVCISAKRIILTENRALLIKMYKTGWFEKDPESFVIGIDGRLRLGHRTFLKLLHKSRPDVSCFIWTDSDSSGISFINDLHGIFPESRIIIIDENSLQSVDFEEFQVIIKENPRLLNREQESFLGGPKDWDKVFTLPNPLLCNPPA